MEFKYQSTKGNGKENVKPSSSTFVKTTRKISQMLCAEKAKFNV